MIVWTDALLKDLANKALELNRRFCGSRAISESFRVSYTVKPPHIDVYTPYYWAPYYKNGVDFIRTPRKGKFLIWYVNPDDDPRIAPVPQGYPVRRSDVRSFTDKEYAQALKDRTAGKAVFARSAGPIPAHDWIDQVSLFWAPYYQQRIKRELVVQVKKVLEPLRGLRIGD